MKKGENMNREIKFRVYNEITGKMSQVKTLCGRYAWDYAIDPVYDTPQKMIDTAYDVEDKSHLMQFTGLKDKNGKEIYEGDILRQWDDLFVITEMEYGSFGITVHKELKNGGTVEDCHYVISALVPDSCEIIGNIYENPYLLEPKP